MACLQVRARRPPPPPGGRRSATAASGIEVERERSSGRELDRAPPLADRRPRRSRRGSSAAPGRWPRWARPPPPPRAARRRGAVSPRAPASPPARAHLGEPLEHLGGRELAVAADAEDAAEHRRRPRSASRAARGKHQRVAERAGQARLVAVRQRVAAHVDEHEQVRAERAQRPRPGRRASADGPSVASTSTVSSPSSSAIRDSAKQHARLPHARARATRPGPRARAAARPRSPPRRAARAADRSAAAPR